MPLSYSMESGHLLTELPAAQNVEVQVMDALAAVVAAVADHAVTVC